MAVANKKHSVTITVDDKPLYALLVQEIKSYVFTNRCVDALFDLSAQLRDSQKSAKDQKNYAYEIRVVLERWILTVAEEEEITDLPAQMLAHDLARRKFLEELADLKHKKNPIRFSSNVINERALQCLQDAQWDVDTGVNLRIEEKTPIHVTWDPKEGVTVVFGEGNDWQITIANTERNSAILERACENNSVDKGLAQTARILLRYHAHLHTSAQHWGPTQGVFDYLVKHFDVRHEGFAAPINARALLSTKKSECTFCSLYKETDDVIGAIGSFFDADLLMDKHGWTVHPPFTESILTDAAAKVEDALERAEAKQQQLCIGLGWCDWQDMLCYKNLASSPYLRMHEKLQKRTYAFEKPDGTLQTATFNNHYFLLSALPLSYAQQEALDGLRKHVHVTQEKKPGYAWNQAGRHRTVSVPGRQAQPQPRTQKQVMRKQGAAAAGARR